MECLEEPGTPTTAARSSGRRATLVLAGTAIVLTALNLRPAVPSFGALLRDVQQATGMSATVAGVLTTLPPICFGVFGLLGGSVGRRLGTVNALLVAMALTATGLAARVTTGRPWLIVVFSVPALAGMAVGNILLPVAVKRWFPGHIGRATGVYSLCIAVGTAAAAGASVPIAQAAGSWRAGLGIWALTPLLAIPPWLWLRRGGGEPASPPDPESAASPPVGPVSPVGRVNPLGPVDPLGPVAPPAPRHMSPAGSVHRQPRAWAFVVFFGMQSLAAYAVFGWLPAIYRDAGISAGRAGLLLAFVIVLGAPISVLLPELAARRPDQRPFVVGLAAASAVSYVGLLVAPAGAPWLPWVWATLLGIGLGTFPLALLLIGLRATTPEGTAQLSGLTQGGGYLLAAGGPFAIGALHDATGGWTLPLLVLIGLLVPQLLCGWVVAKPGHIDAPG